MVKILFIPRLLGFFDGRSLFLVRHGFKVCVSLLNFLTEVLLVKFLISKGLTALGIFHRFTNRLFFFITSLYIFVFIYGFFLSVILFPSTKETVKTAELTHL